MPQALSRLTDQGCGDSTSGRVMAFYLGKPYSNPKIDLGFFQVRIAVNLFSLTFSNSEQKNGTYYFLFFTVFYHC